MIIKQCRIGGMTCANCQNIIENKIKNLHGIKKVSVNYKSGIAQIEFNENKISFIHIEKEIKKLGYKVLSDKKVSKIDIFKAICLVTIILVLYTLLEHFGVLNLLVPSKLADSSMGYGMLFVMGLLTSVHCIAMCGGINLSQCLRDKKFKNDEKKSTVFLPSVLYNFGRVISYTVIGFLLGLVGWIIGGNTNVAASTLLQGILKLIVGLLMVIMGINMLGIFPALRRLSIKMPKFITKFIGSKSTTNTRPFIVGLLNGLMPCGPLQSMQILALASANPFSGALSMLLFSLGTVPLMLGLGAIVTALGKKFTHAVMNIGAVMVTVLGLAMLNQGGNLSGLISSKAILFFSFAFSAVGIISIVTFPKKLYKTVAITAAVALVATTSIVWHFSDSGKLYDNSKGEITKDVQIIDSTLLSHQYPTITVQKDVPVKWNINAPKDSINGCNYKMIIQEYGIEHTFDEGENIIEFTPNKVGTFSYTCWMGMIEGNIIVTEYRP